MFNRKIQQKFQKFFLISSLIVLFSGLSAIAQPSNQEERKELTIAEKAELDKKEEELKAMLEKNPRLAEVHLNLGNIYWTQGRDGKPIRHYLAAIKLKPDYAEAYYNLGNVFFTQGEHEQAVKSYRKAIELKETFAPAHNGLGNALIDEKNYAAAIESYKRAVDLNPSYNEAIYNLCSAYMYAAKYSDAVTACQRATNIQRDARAYNNLGNAYFRTKQFDLALKAYNNALEVEPELPEAHFNIAAISLVYKKDKAEALNRERILKVIDPQKSHKLSALIKSSGI
ncbi:MAG: tetratricopeptide repeat protein [Candidatus Caenarcaniphilales bacterium]|nr:tetratricopeptide repeat protein [Candidatus Caenarcaniphilales bacterium]